MDFNSEKITTFREVIDKITYDWGFDPKNLTRLKDGTFMCNKTFILEDRLEYKTECHELAPGLYQKLEQFYELLEEN